MTMKSTSGGYFLAQSSGTYVKIGDKFFGILV